MHSNLLRKLAATGYPNEVEILEKGGDRLFEVDSLRKPGSRMLVALSEDGDKDYPVLDAGAEKVKWQAGDRFSKKFKDTVKKHMIGELEEAETPKEKTEAVNSPALRAASLKQAAKCPVCGSEVRCNCPPPPKRYKFEPHPSGRTKVVHAAKTAGWDEIRPGDRLTIKVPGGLGRNGVEWVERTGRVVMRSAEGGWVLNMGGPHGTPGLATPDNTTAIRHAPRKRAGMVHRESDIAAWGYTPLDIPAQAEMPTWTQMRKLHQERNIAWQGIAAWRTEGGWKFYLRPDAKKGFVEEPMLPKRGASPRQCPFCRAERVQPVGVFEGQEIFECPDCGRDFPMAQAVEMHTRPQQRVAPAMASAKRAAATVHDIKPLVDKLRQVDPAEHMNNRANAMDLTERLVDLAKRVGARDLRLAAQHYLEVLEKMGRYGLPGSARHYTGADPMPPRLLRTHERAWKQLEAAFTGFVR